MLELNGLLRKLNSYSKSKFGTPVHHAYYMMVFAVIKNCIFERLKPKLKQNEENMKTLKKTQNQQNSPKVTQDTSFLGNSCFLCQKISVSEKN